MMMVPEKFVPEWIHSWRCSSIGLLCITSATNGQFELGHNTPLTIFFIFMCNSHTANNSKENIFSCQDGKHTRTVPNCCTHCIWCYINPPHTIRWHHLFSFHLAKSKTFVQMFHIKVQLGMKMKKKKKKKEQWESKQRTSIWTRTYIVHICGSVTSGAMLQPLQKPYT